MVDHDWKGILGLAHVSTGQCHAVRPARIVAESVPCCVRIALELDQALWRRVKEPVSKCQPESRYACAVDTLPKELGGNLVAARAALEPVRVITREFQELRHLGMVPKCVEPPSHSYGHT